MNPSPVNPFHDTVRWLAAHTPFPASRLESRAEIMLCMAALAAGENEVESQRFLVKSRDGAKDAALRAHAQRRSHAHFKSDNSAKV
jgi:hypothetical protein